MKKMFLVLVVLLVLVGGAWAYLYLSKPKDSQITSFEQCASAGNLVVDTKPRECHMKDGKFFVEEGNAEQMMEAIQVTDPKPRQVVTSPFKVEGKALSKWFYNNQISVKLIDGNERVLATVNAKAQTGPTGEEMMTFIGVVNFQTPNTEKGKLIIEKTNPLDKTEPMGPLVIPVRFK